MTKIELISDYKDKFFFFFGSETKILRKYRKTTKCHDTIITCAAETGVHEFIILTPPIGFMGHEGNNMFPVHSSPTRPKLNIRNMPKTRPKVPKPIENPSELTPRPGRAQADITN